MSEENNVKVTASVPMKNMEEIRALAVINEEDYLQTFTSTLQLGLLIRKCMAKGDKIFVGDSNKGLNELVFSKHIGEEAGETDQNSEKGNEKT
jgi:hypothetical protein